MNLLVETVVPAYSVVVPVYNSAASVRELVTRTEQVFRDTLKQSYEILLVDDGSTNPETWPTLEALATAAPGRTAIQLMRNFGNQGALLAGLEAARGQYIITMDDDLQHRPEDIPLLLEQRAHDIVIARFPIRYHNAWQRSVSRIKNWLDYQLVGKPRHITTGPFKVVKSEIVHVALKVRTPYPFLSALLYFVTRDVVNVDLPHAPRKYGRSGFTPAKMLSAISNLVINNSSFLLRVMAVVGMAIAVASSLIGIVVLIEKMTGQIKVPGWTSLMLLVALFGGLTQFTLGVTGEYLIRIIATTESRPAFIVRRIVQYGQHAEPVTPPGSKA